MSQEILWPPRAMKNQTSVTLSQGYEALPLSEDEASAWNRCLDECQKAAQSALSDAAKYRKICKAFDGMKTSTSERFLECLGLDGKDVLLPLDQLISESDL